MNTTARFLALLLLTATAGCATLLGGGSSQPMSISATPSGATYSIRSSSGLEMSSGALPASITLPRKNEYQVDISLPGYETRTMAVTRSTNGWIWGNLVIGWIVGFAIDFATGSAYKLEPATLNVSFTTGPDVAAIVHFLNGDGDVVREERLDLVPTT